MSFWIDICPNCMGLIFSCKKKWPQNDPMSYLNYSVQTIRVIFFPKSCPNKAEFFKKRILCPIKPYVLHKYCSNRHMRVGLHESKVSSFHTSKINKFKMYIHWMKLTKQTKKWNLCQIIQIRHSKLVKNSWFVSTRIVSIYNHKI